MPIFGFDVNVSFYEKLVPITHLISVSIRPAVVTIVLKQVEESSKNGPLREREAKAYFVMWKLLMRER